MVYQPSSRDVPATPPDDAAEILRACRNLFIKELSQLLQEGERVPAAAVQSFQAGVSQYFDAMVSASRKGNFDQSAGLTASRISLVHENDLELEIRLGEFTARLQEKTGSELWRVYLRFVTLLGRPDLSTADNPVGPKGIAAGLQNLCSELSENHDKVIERIERLETYFADNLTVLYTSLNDFLATRHVDAAQANLITSPDSPRAATPSAPSFNAAAALQRNLLGPQAGTTQSYGNSVGTGTGGGSGGGGGGGAAASLFSQAMFDRLLARLDELEKLGHHPTRVQASQTLGGASLETLIPGLFAGAADTPGAMQAPRAIKSDELGIPTGAPEAATIDALAMIFEAIFASTNLPDAVKSALSSLQIPLLKAAMLDNSLFSSEEHPARQLLDKMAQAAIGLPLDVPATHPICSSIQAIASKVRTEFSRDMAVFEVHCASLDNLIQERDQAASRLATKHQPLLADLARENQAALRSRQIIGQFCERSIPASVAIFLRQHWQRLLQKIWMSGGEQSEEWKSHITVIEHLLWSIEAKIQIEDRKQLAKILPGMLKMLNAGMERLALPDSERSGFLDTCFSLQTAALRGVGTPPASAQEKAPSEEAGNDFSEIRADGLWLKTARQRNPSPAAKTLPANVRDGDWLRFEFDGQRLCGCLFQNTDTAESLLITNPEWTFAIALPTGLLANLLRDKQAAVVSGTSLFNKAAEKALRNTPEMNVLT